MPVSPHKKWLLTDNPAASASPHLSPLFTACEISLVKHLAGASAPPGFGVKQGHGKYLACI